jgi:hypothetical protein
MAHLKIRTGHQSTPTQDVQGAIQPQENSILEDLKDLRVGVSKPTSIQRDNKDNPKTSTSNSTPSLIDQNQHSASSRRMHNLQNLKRVVKEIGQGKSPTSTIVDGTSPQYWTIRTDNEGYDDESDQNWEDRCCLKDQLSIDEHQLWIKRGGLGAGLRFAAGYGFDSCICHIAVRLVDGASGNSCVGINFVAQHVEKKTSGKTKTIMRETGEEDISCWSRMNYPAIQRSSWYVSECGK